MSSEQGAYLFSGSSHPGLAQMIANHSQVGLGKIQIKTFPDGEIFVQIQESVRGKDIFVVQSLAHRPNHYLMELLIIVDALKRASAKTIVLLITYLAYARQDRKDQKRVPITAKLVANMIEKAGADRVVAMDLHADQIQGFFDIPVDQLFAKSEMVNHVEKLNLKSLIVGAPDMGSLKFAKAVSDKIHSDLVIIDKRRINVQEVELSPLIGSVKGKNVLLVDDMCSTATTLCKAAEACKDNGAVAVYALVTHGLFVADALEKIEKSPLEKVFVSDTIPQNHKKCDKIEVVSVAKVFGEAVRSILYGSSISSLFVD